MHDNPLAGWALAISIVSVLAALTALYFTWQNHLLAHKADQRADAAHEMAAKNSERQDRAERRAAVLFAVEPDGTNWYTLRNIGTERAQGVRIDPASVLGVRVGGSTYSSGLDPQQGMNFQLSAGTPLEVPDTIRVIWDNSADEEQAQVVRFPRAQPD